jgi:hypothetical protein
MSEPKCTVCGAELIPGTGFCRQCGAPATEVAEQPTAILSQPVDGTTQRLDPRSTSPGKVARSPDSLEFPDALTETLAPPGARPRKFLVVGIVILSVMISAAVVGVVRSVLQSRTEAQQTGQISRALIYPGSRIVLDIGHDGGGSVLQLETDDSLQKVQAWYGATLKPDKILQATMTAVIMRKDNVTATLVSESNTTTIVIKQTGR